MYGYGDILKKRLLKKCALEVKEIDSENSTSATLRGYLSNS